MSSSMYKAVAAAAVFVLGLIAVVDVGQKKTNERAEQNDVTVPAAASTTASVTTSDNSPLPRVIESRAGVAGDQHSLWKSFGSSTNLWAFVADAKRRPQEGGVFLADRAVWECNFSLGIVAEDLARSHPNTPEAEYLRSAPHSAMYARDQAIRRLGSICSGFSRADSSIDAELMRISNEAKDPFIAAINGIGELSGRPSGTLGKTPQERSEYTAFVAQLISSPVPYVVPRAVYQDERGAFFEMISTARLAGVTVWLDRRPFESLSGFWNVPLGRSAVPTICWFCNTAQCSQTAAPTAAKRWNK